MEKKKTVKLAKKTTKKVTKKVVKPKKTSVKKKKKGFTLIELLAVIIILGILMIIAIPAVTSYINDSRKSAYIDTAKQVISGARNLVNEGKLGLFDKDISYYIDVACINTENDLKSPYGEFEKAYVVVNYNGDSYDYYWTSVDETGVGISKIMKLDKLDSNLIESDLDESDILNTAGVDGRSKYMIIDESTNCEKGTANNVTKKINGATGEEEKPICKRATDLHTETCNKSACQNAGYVEGNKGTTISYGSLGEKDILKSGDAFDCDVNGDGEFDSVHERFYYVSDYYDTDTKQFNSSYAVLLFYTDVRNGSVYYNFAAKYYSGANENWHGPIALMKELPSVDQWSNVKLLKVNRSLVNELGEYTSNNGNNQLEKINYQYNNIDRAARLLTFQELAVACNINIPSYNLEKIYSCDYLLEKTGYANGQYGYWLENASSTDYFNNYDVLAAQPYVTMKNPTNQSTTSTRPAIEIPKSKIEY